MPGLFEVPNQSYWTVCTLESGSPTLNRARAASAPLGILMWMPSARKSITPAPVTPWGERRSAGRTWMTVAALAGAAERPLAARPATTTARAARRDRCFMGQTLQRGWNQQGLGRGERNTHYARSASLPRESGAAEAVQCPAQRGPDWTLGAVQERRPRIVNPA